MPYCVRYFKIRCSSVSDALDFALVGRNINESYFTLVAHSLARAVCHTHTPEHHNNRATCVIVDVSTVIRSCSVRGAFDSHCLATRQSNYVK